MDQAKLNMNLEVLNYDMSGLYEEQRETPISMREKMRTFNQLRVDIYNILKTPCEEKQMTLKRIVPIGSVAMRLSKHYSNLNIIICIEKTDGDEGQFFGNDNNAILRYLTEKLKTLEGYEEINYIDEIVPSITGFNNNVAIQITSHYGSSVPTSYIAARFMGNVIKFYPSFAILHTALKGIFKNDQLGNNQQYFPNSYALSMMITHFLVEKEFLPNLHQQYPERFDPKNATWDFEMIPDNDVLEFGKNETPAQILYHFLEYYINKPICSFSINMKNNEMMERNQSLGLVIIDPFDDHNPGRLVTDNRPFIECLKRTQKLIETLELWDMPRLIDGKSEIQNA
ncbi:unnamed protein product [Caenorhabditis angaria]|uniref:PAP-associated domain-containing protein n=1 Tax=Caenorhabditis angaria TaxID=860376 RepID=A0A9P1NB80_9PELO|nr:unnamed protein product [Caenorhabditis angaria]